MIAGTGQYEWKELSAQDSVLKNLDKGQRYMECNSAGTVAMLQSEGYGSGRFWFSKVAGSTPLIHFIHSKTDGAGNGYVLRINISETVGLYEALNGGITFMFYTAAAYIVADTWYEVEWTRTLDGEFTVKIRGGTFTGWTLIVAGGGGTNPIIDQTYQDSIYQVLDLDVGDRFIDGTQRKGVQQ